MKHLFFSFRLILSAILLVFCVVRVSAQFETTVGNVAANEEAWDGKPIPGDAYIMLGTTFSAPPMSKIVLSKLNNTGGVVWMRTIGEDLLHYSGRAIELELNAAGAHVGYFITGCRQLPNGRQIILLRTDLEGIVTWARHLPAIVAGVNLDECGVSVERQSNGDVIVTGSSQHVESGTSKFVIARFSRTGVMGWCKRYGSITGHSFEPAEACNGMRSGLPVVAVTGKYIETGVEGNHTFLACVDAATGVEIWRRMYDSGNLLDEGLDVVFKPLPTNNPTGLFMVVGASGGVHPSVWVVNAHASSGAISSSAVYGANIHNSAFVARAVTLSVGGSNAVIAGSIYGLPPFFSRAFAMEIPFSTGAPLWAQYYDGSDPQGTASESIERKTDGATGYFITCGSHLIPASPFDLHAIRVNPAGLHGKNACAIVALPVTPNAQGISATRIKTDANATWTAHLPTNGTLLFNQFACSEMQPVYPGSTDRTAGNSTTLVEPNLMPNPVPDGQAVRLNFQLAAGEAVVVQVFDLTGRQIWSYSNTLPIGEHSLSLPANEWNSGAYFVRLQSLAWNRSLKLIVGK